VSVVVLVGVPELVLVGVGVVLPVGVTLSDKVLVVDDVPVLDGVLVSLRASECEAVGVPDVDAVRVSVVVGVFDEVDVEVGVGLPV